MRAHVQDMALEFRGADFDWKHTGWQHSAANLSLSTAAARSLSLEAQPCSATNSIRRTRRKGRAVADAKSLPESPAEPLLKQLRFSVRRGELLGICGEVRNTLHHMVPCEKAMVTFDDSPTAVR